MGSEDKTITLRRLTWKDLHKLGAVKTPEGQWLLPEKSVEKCLKQHKAGPKKIRPR